MATLFAETFAASEGADEGEVIRAFVADMLATTPAPDLHVFTALDEGAPVGCILFSRLRYDDTRTVFILSPVAVRPGHQGRGVGQGLITHGLGALRDSGVDYAITYGDPAYYTRVGFAQITQDFAPAPLPLSQPIGWLGQSLSETAPAPFAGPSHCVSALNNPGLW
ncbi:N-acetyltransferase [Escherichia coli]|nr:N-acetyltransferase [Escherichia coli]